MRISDWSSDVCSSDLNSCSRMPMDRAMADELRRIRRLAPAMRPCSSAAMNALRCLSEKLLSDSLTALQVAWRWMGYRSKMLGCPEADRRHESNMRAARL